MNKKLSYLLTNQIYDAMVKCFYDKEHEDDIIEEVRRRIGDKIKEIMAGRASAHYVVSMGQEHPEVWVWDKEDKTYWDEYHELTVRLRAAGRMWVEG